MSKVNRMINIFKQVVTDARLNSTVNKEELYNTFLHKLKNIHLNEQYLINDNDYNVINNYIIKLPELSAYFDEIFDMREKIQDALLSMNFSVLEQIYIGKYNYLNMFEIIRYKHIEVPEHVEQLEDELFKTTSFCRNLMVFIFGCTRKILESTTEVFYRQPYCSPQNAYRQLESFKRASDQIIQSQMSSIENIMQVVREHYKQILNALHLIKEQVSVLIIYYQKSPDAYQFNVVQDNQVHQSYSMYIDNDFVQQRQSELKELQKILLNKQDS